MRLDRNKWTGCDKCTFDWDFDNESEWGNRSFGEVRIGKGEMLCDMGVTWYITKIKFCPFCGKPLTEQAWEELERRVKTKKWLDLLKA